MKDYHINIFYSDEDGGYIADIPVRGGILRKGFKGSFLNYERKKMYRPGVFSA